MIPNDQLTKQERLRLESLSQSMAATSMSSNERPTLDLIFENAKRIEEFLKASNPN